MISVFMDLDYVLVHLHAKKKKKNWPIRSALTSRAVNNPYVTSSTMPSEEELNYMFNRLLRQYCDIDEK